MIIYHVEALDENYIPRGTFITTNFEHALEAGKKMYEEENVEMVDLNYWEDESLIMIKMIDEDGNIGKF